METVASSRHELITVRFYDLASMRYWWCKSLTGRLLWWAMRMVYGQMVLVHVNWQRGRFVYNVSHTGFEVLSDDDHYPAEAAITMQWRVPHALARWNTWHWEGKSFTRWPAILDFLGIPHRSKVRSCVTETAKALGLPGDQYRRPHDLYQAMLDCRNE